MLSRVEYQARKPACDLVTRSVSSEQLFNLEFSIDVNNFFTCDIGVRQGENLSLFLFVIYLNDLEEFLTEHCKTGLDTLNGLSFENLPNTSKLDTLMHQIISVVDQLEY
jgi:hypothetical protein